MGKDVIDEIIDEIHPVLAKKELNIEYDEQLYKIIIFLEAIAKDVRVKFESIKEDNIINAFNKLKNTDTSKLIKIIEESYSKIITVEKEDIEYLVEEVKLMSLQHLDFTNDHKQITILIALLIENLKNERHKVPEQSKRDILLFAWCKEFEFIVSKLKKIKHLDKKLKDDDYFIEFTETIFRLGYLKSLIEMDKYKKYLQGLFSSEMQSLRQNRYKAFEKFIQKKVLNIYKKGHDEYHYDFASKLRNQTLLIIKNEGKKTPNVKNSIYNENLQEEIQKLFKKIDVKIEKTDAQDKQTDAQKKATKKWEKLRNKFEKKQDGQNDFFLRIVKKALQTDKKFEKYIKGAPTSKKTDKK